MGKPPTQIESFESPNLDHEELAEEHGAHPKAAKATYIVLVVLLVVLIALVGVGLHIPAD
ncbi:MAG TPA: hypothetical protein VIV11_07510 [Kofleriaceae bacterium]